LIDSLFCVLRVCRSNFHRLQALASLELEQRPHTRDNGERLCADTQAHKQLIERKKEQNIEFGDCFGSKQAQINERKEAKRREKKGNKA
jgi:hypothetical protein